MTDLDTPLIADYAADLERLKRENERLKARNAALANSLKALLLDTATGLFAASGSEERAARAALLANEVTP